MCAVFVRKRHPAMTASCVPPSRILKPVLLCFNLSLVPSVVIPALADFSLSWPNPRLRPRLCQNILGCQAFSNSSAVDCYENMTNKASNTRTQDHPSADRKSTLVLTAQVHEQAYASHLIVRKVSWLRFCQKLSCSSSKGRNVVPKIQYIFCNPARLPCSTVAIWSYSILLWPSAIGMLPVAIRQAWKTCWHVAEDLTVYIKEAQVGHS